MPPELLKQTHDLMCFDALTEIVDVGANPLDDNAPYQPLLGAGLCRVTGFEPQGLALAALNDKKSSAETYLPYAIGDGSRQTLNVCRHSGWTGTLTPSKISLDIFSAFNSNATILSRTPIETRRLDDISEINSLDFLKIDIQGGELSAFRNAETKLSKAVVIQTEVSFVNLYDDQPSFGEVDIELRRQGFIPHHMPAIKRSVISPFLLNNDPWRTLNQLVEADIVYVRDYRKLDDLDDDQLRHMGLVVLACYGSYDLAYRCVLALEVRKSIPEGSARHYLDLVNIAMSVSSGTGR